MSAITHECIQDQMISIIFFFRFFLLMIMDVLHASIQPLALPWVRRNFVTQTILTLDGCHECIYGQIICLFDCLPHDCGSTACL